MTFVFALAVMSPLQAHALEDWPQWRGPDRSGVSKEKGLLQTWPEHGPTQIWEAKGLGEGYGAVAIRGDRIYVQGTDDQNKSAVFCLSRSDGKRLWKQSLGPVFVESHGNGPRATPTVEKDVLYALTGMGDLACLHIEDGKPVWQSNILEDFEARHISWGICESPLVDGNNLIVTPGGSNGGMVALDKRTGNPVWAAKGLGGNAAYASCIAADVGGVRILMNFTSVAGVGVRASDGEVMWQVEAPANDTANCATPIFHNNRVFFTSNYGNGCGLYRLEPQGGKVKADEVYFNREMQNHHGGVILVDGYLYGFSDAVLKCMEFETGKEMWKARSVGKGSITYADGRLYLLSEGNVVGLAEATPAGYREKGRFQIEDQGRPSWAYPVVCGGRLYIRNQDVLTCHDVRDRTALTSKSE